MGKYIVTGGNKLSGELKVNGSKNTILPILAATILNGDINIIHNCPQISDLYLTIEILEKLGCEVSWHGRTIVIDSRNADKNEIDGDLVRQMRSSIIFLGSLMGRFNEVAIGRPGGCKIGERPIDFHISAIKKMGAIITEKEGILYCKASELKGAKINLDFPSVGATENIMLAGIKAKGRTIIYNAAREPEIVDLQNYLNSMGAIVHGAGTETIYIDGVDKLNGVEYSALPDRIESGTYLIAASITKGEVYLKDARPDTMSQTLLRLSECGNIIKEDKNGIYLKAPKVIKPINKIQTLPYPGFPTDMQPQLMTLLTLAEGTSIIIETVFEMRYKHVIELCQMGADISVENRTAVIKGVPRLRGSYVFAQDLRGGAALILAGLVAEGKTTVCNSQYVERGYEKIENALTILGADIRYEN